MMKWTKTRNVSSPERANGDDSWIDFFIPNEAGTIQIMTGENVLIPLGIKLLLPEWYDFTFVNKSWITSKTWLITWACLVDNWYRGELVLNLINTSKFEVRVKGGQKIIQGVIREVSYMLPEEISEDEYVSVKKTETTGRWEGGYWSTGI